MIAVSERAPVGPAHDAADAGLGHDGGADRRAFLDEVLPHLDAARRLAQRLTGNEPDADDLVQDAFLRALRAQHQYRLGTNARAWLLTIVRRTFLSSIRDQGRRDRPIPSDVWRRLVGEDRLTDPERRLHGLEVEGLIDSAVARLPDAYRTAFQLRLRDLEYEDIAEATGVALGTVRSRIHRARRLLQDWLAFAGSEYGVRTDT